MYIITSLLIGDAVNIQTLLRLVLLLHDIHHAKIAEKPFRAGRGMLRNAESCEQVICGKCNADFFCGMKGKVRNESMRNVTEMNIC